LPHPGAVVIQANRIGRDVTVQGSITIGMRDSTGFPTIGNDVFIGCGARILGSITVGDGARIGANAVVLVDVPPGCTAVGVPARIIRPRTNE
jgi:serine O-acetyltransferase